ncbi:hypothetical protein Gasu2_25310 [Galdieria sulphuraria]|uniref:BZIP domain-containing protein n=1 Tax=Galdieria sulphuraria TaxID=130081 RepID=M2W524_GALSU|nr:uncharacterized protein Gasu_18470 [Galdieria sulphuraria]EME30831.1 hypothetical protein Gasu_18470 [Galdieria sulphuraria]GJD08228.1 hypothetical protein Gasu2_25310 [Galdieria sulphuraria]|eukprot:XP_005707351.1 hypothetical protein Gasu_18470 [Galdieria sulphuraria]
MTSLWQQTCHSLPLQRSLEEITEWIDSGQSLPLNSGSPATGEFLSGWLTGYRKQNSATEPIESTTTSVGNMRKSYHLCNEDRVFNSNENISEVIQKNGTKHSLSFVPIAPAISSSQYDRCLKHSSNRAACSDEFLNEVTDLSGTTANRGRKMTPRERDIMLFKRKLRNRDSASRSRMKKKMIKEELNNDFESLVHFYQSKEEEAENFISRAEKKRMELIDERRRLVKELESLGTELRNAKKQLRHKETVVMDKYMQQKEERLSPSHSGFEGKMRQMAPFDNVELERGFLETPPKSSRLISS